MRKLYTCILFLFVLSISSNSFGQIVANNDNVPSSINGLIGGVWSNVFSNDTLNGSPVNSSDVTVSIVSSTVGFIQPSGLFIINPGTPAGYYSIQYQICETANPSNCDTAYIYVYVTAAPIDAVNDGAFTLDATTGGITPAILLNDTLNGVPVLPYQITLTVSSMSNPAFILNPNGTITLNAGSGIPSGTYTVTYQICEVLNPTNCDTATVTIVVQNNLIINITPTYNDFNSDGFVNVGDVVNYQYSLTNNESTSATNISLSSPNVTIYGGTLASLAPGATNNTTFTGTHVITQNDINTHTVNTTVTSTGINNGVTVNSSVSNSFNLSVSDGIRLNAFLDTNNNGIQDSGETNSGYYGSFAYTINGGSPNYIFANPSNIAYLYESNPATLYNLSFVVGNSYYTTPLYTCTTTYSNVTVTTGSGITTYNFPVQYNPFTDLGVILYSYLDPPMPGFTYNNVIFIRNNGTQTIPSGTVTFTKDANVNITGVNQTVTNTPTGFTYNFTNLLPFQTRSITVTMQVPTIPTVALGQQLTNAVSATIPSSDVLVSNNTSSLTQTIVGSYDPNDKQEIHGGRIVHSTFTSNDFLTYTIRFENTGTANAINIKVDDFLDSKLDENSIVMVASSHNYVLNRNGSNLSWRFNGINLPPSNGSATIGHGYITFQIKPKSGYAIGDIIPNYANIYFDFNPAIITNVCTTEFVATLSNPNFAFNDLNYFPNPVKNSLSISNSNTIDFIEITSVLGQKILAQKVNDLETEIDMSNLSKGIYFVKIGSQNQEKVVKIVKE